VCQFINSYLINNYCHDTCIPYGCAGGSNGSGYQIKGWGSYGNTIRNNVCVRVNQVCLLLYDDFDLGPNIVEGNWAYGNVIDAGIQVAAGAIIRNNVIYGNVGGIVVTSNTADLMLGKQNRNIQIVGNTFVNNQGTGMNLPVFSPTSGTRIVNNAVFEDSGSAFKGGDQTGVTWANNAYYGGSVLSGVASSGVKLVGTSATELQGPTSYNFHPSATSKLLGAGAALTSNDLTYDFDCVVRSQAAPTIGAFEKNSNNVLTLGFQPPCSLAGTAPTSAPTPAKGTQGTNGASGASVLSCLAFTFACSLMTCF